MKRELCRILAALAISAAAVSTAIVGTTRGAGETLEEMVKGSCKTDEQRRTLMQALAQLEEVGKNFCKNEIVSELISPDKKWKAVIFQRRCGVGARDTTDVSIIPVSETLKNEPGNAFALDGIATYSLMSLEWNAPSQLTITYNRNEVVCFAARFAAETMLFYKLAPKP